MVSSSSSKPRGAMAAGSGVEGQVDLSRVFGRVRPGQVTGTVSTWSRASFEEGEVVGTDTPEHHAPARYSLLSDTAATARYLGGQGTVPYRRNPGGCNSSCSTRVCVCKGEGTRPGFGTAHDGSGRRYACVARRPVTKNCPAAARLLKRKWSAETPEAWLD